MAEKRDYYEVLGISRTATEVEIKSAYRKMARQYHPDINKDDHAEERFKEVNEAYEVLSNPERRAGYDRFGHAASGAGGDPFGGFGAGSPFSDLFDSFFGGGNGRARTAAPPRGSDIQISVSLRFEEAVFGTEKDVEIDRLETCDVCHGTRMKDGKTPPTCGTCGGSGEVRRVQQTILGQFMTSGPCPVCQGEGVTITDPCDVCRGRGRRRQYRTIAVTVPAGVDDNATLRLTGQGEDAPGGQRGQPGNLYVKVRVKPHKIFERHGKGIHSQVGINVAQAALGDEVEIETIDGPVMFRIPSGTQSGQQFRLREKGVPDLRGGSRGDQIVTLQVVTPKKLSDDQRALFEELASSLGSDIQQQPNSKGFFGRVKDALGAKA